jgi:hypothetical protein
MFWGFLFVVAAVVADLFAWPIQTVLIVAIFALLVLLDDLKGGISLDAALKNLHRVRKAVGERK